MSVTQKESGILASHIPTIQDFAREKKCFVLFRPVNADATFLIGQKYATKGLDIHGKSSDWGPMAGFVPRNQALSKSAGNSMKIKDGNERNQKSLDEKGEVIAEQLALTSEVVSEWKKRNRISREIGEFTSKTEDGKISRRFKIEKTDGRYLVFYESEGASDGETKKGYVPLEVMAYKKIGAVTADYDLFALLTTEGSFTRFDFEIQGVMTTQQASLIEDLNKRLSGKTRQVINHGTECDNPRPERDTRLALFLPDGTSYLLLAQGGEKHLSYLFAAAFALGYKVYCNDQWKGGGSGRPDPVSLKYAYGRLVVDHCLSPSLRHKKSTDGFYGWFFKQRLDEKRCGKLMSSEQRVQLELAHKKMPLKGWSLGEQIHL